MSNQLNRLKRLLQQDAPAVQGVVLSIGSTITVSTSRGVVSASRQAGDITQYRPGDKVRLNGGIIAGKVKAATEFYVL